MDYWQTVEVAPSPRAISREFTVTNTEGRSVWESDKFKAIKAVSPAIKPLSGGSSSPLELQLGKMWEPL